MDKVFAINRKGFNLSRGLELVGVLLVPLVVLGALNKDKYLLSVTFGILFTGLSDPGGAYAIRLREMALVGVLGTGITAVGFAIGGGPWGLIVLAVFIVTLLSGLALKFGPHRFVSASFLNAWFLVVISVPAAEHLSPSTSGWAGQALAWSIGSALWIALTLLAWLLRGRHPQASNFPEIPGDMSDTELSRPVLLFAVIRALAVGVAVAIAFGLHVPDADWMPIATLVAMKGSLDQTTLVAEQRLAGALVGALVAMFFLLTLKNKHALEIVILFLGAVAATIRGVNYALYCAAVAALVLVGMDISHPTNFTPEFHRVLFTFAGVGIAWLVMLIANVVKKQRGHEALAHRPSRVHRLELSDASGMHFRSVRRAVNQSLRAEKHQCFGAVRLSQPPGTGSACRR